MRFRRLRIACSTVWGIACLLLIALWVRSFLIVDRICLQFPPCCVGAWSIKGELDIVTTTIGPIPRLFWIAHYPIQESPVGTSMSEYELGLGFGAGVYQGVAIATIPCWFLVLLAVANTSAPWLRW
jgi:hypothetical protein